jgi:hypothetical protein
VVSVKRKTIHVQDDPARSVQLTRGNNVSGRGRDGSRKGTLAIAETQAGKTYRLSRTQGFVRLAHVAFDVAVKGEDLRWREWSEKGRRMRAVFHKERPQR